MPKQLQDSVVVITGASSGIGHATALEFARQGANVVVAARRDSLLQEVANECKQLSGREALAVPTDVRDEQSVQNLAQQAADTFGHIDVWVNNAGVGAFGRFEETPPDIFREVIETNFFGEVYGARAVLPYFRKQNEGTLINISSLLGSIGGAYYTAYTASKFAVRAFGEGLREEIEALDGSKSIRVCTVMPATIDTPFFHHAANYTGRAVKALPPVYPAEQVAKTIVKLAVKPQRETYVGNSGRMIGFMHNIAPIMAEAMMAKQIDTGHFKPEAAPATSGAVSSPMSTGTGISDGWQGGPQSIARTLAAVGVATGAAALLTWAWLRNRNNS
jgi:short-subunit dehydrogenase